MSRIDELSVEEIVNTIGINLADEELSGVFNQNRKIIQEFRDVAREMQREEKRKIRQRNEEIRDLLGIEKYDGDNFGIDTQKMEFVNGRAIMEILKKYANFVNKRYLVLAILYNNQKCLETRGGEFSTSEKKHLAVNVRNAMRIIGSESYIITQLEDEIDSDLIHRVKVLDSQQIIKEIERKGKLENIERVPKKKLERLDEIDENVGLQNLIAVLGYEDIKYRISTNEQVGDAILAQISWNSVQRYLNNRPELNKEEIINDENVFMDMELEVVGSEEYRQTVVEALRNNCRYIDVDKLLLNSAYRMIYLLENDGFKNMEENKTLDIIYTILKSVETRIAKNTVIQFWSDDKEGEGEYTVKDFEKGIEKFFDGRFVKEKEIEELKQQLISGEIKFEEADSEVLSFIVLSEEELMQTVQNSEENIIFLIEVGIITNYEMVKILQQNKECSGKLFSIIMEKGLLTFDEIIQLFEEGILNVNNISQISDEEIIKKINQYTRIKIKELYLSISGKEQDDDKIEQFGKYASLYKKLNLIERSEKEISENSSELISSFEEEIGDEILEGLYQYGLIPLDTAADWGVDLNRMLLNNSIKPMDLKDLFSRGIIKIEQIIDVLKREILPYEEKIDLIYSTFDGESEEEYKKREELVGMIGIGEEYKSEGKTNKRIIERKGTLKNREFITDPHARWKLISLLDRDYSKKFLPKGKEVLDGHRVFLLPNQDRIVIEKMHEMKRGMKVSAYGSATYIMEAEEFFSHIEQIIINGAINRGYLRELSEEEKAIKIIHSKGWGETIKRYFNINCENKKYTKEEVEEIDEAIKNVVNSRKERGK